MKKINKYHQVIKTIKTDFRNTVYNFLKLEFTNYEIKRPKNITSQYASIWFHNDVSNLKECWFGIESFSGIGNNNGVLFVGVFDKKGILNLNKDYNSLNKVWVHHVILTHEGVEVNLSDISFLESINNTEKLETVAKDIASQITQFIKTHQHLINA